MSLYLAIFDEDTQLDGWCFGHYSDFGAFRDAIDSYLAASDYPVLMTHSDCDGEWSLNDIPKLKNELRQIADQFRKLPAITPKDSFEHTAQFRIGAASLYDCYHNVDGENVFEALIALCDKAIELRKPILLQ